MKQFDKWPNAKVIMDHMDIIMHLLGYASNNGKGWTGYYDTRGGQQRAAEQLSWQQARKLCVDIYDTVCTPRDMDVNGVKISGYAMMDIDNYMRINVKEVDVVRQLVYHKKERKISLIGYNEFKIED